jgi:4-carboxymuconolactone decarboxylase
MSEITKNDIFNAGLALRREVLGDEYVDRAFAVKDEFSEDVQNYITTHAWGAVWARRGDDGELTLPKKTRSIMNLAMLAAINRPHELWRYQKRNAGDFPACRNLCRSAGDD